MQSMPKISMLVISAVLALIIVFTWHAVSNRNVLFESTPIPHGFLKGITFPEHQYLKARISINGYQLTADIAGTPQQQATGLAIKSSLNENQAMLFPYGVASLEGFWMKDMLFPIDIMWVDSNNTIVHIESNLSPCVKGSLCPIYTPPFKVIYVLEVVAGFAQRHNVIAGQTKITDLQLLK